MFGHPVRLVRRQRRGALAAVAGAALIAAGLVAPPALAEDDVTDLGTASDHGAEAPALDDTRLDGSDTAVSGKYLVQVAGSPEAQGGARSRLQSAQRDVADDAEAAGIDLAVETTYTRAWNGMAVAVDDADVGKLRALPGVEGVFPVLQVALPDEHDASPQDEYANAMTGVDQVQKVDGLDGSGITVGIIDSGVDYNNPDLGGSGTDDERRDFPNARVTMGYDFVGDDYDSSQDGAAHAPRPDAYPDDCGGHGSHVAGIVGAEGEVTGVAPHVSLASYRIFGCEGTSSSDVILAAMDRAYADGVDVVNMSLGASFMTWGDYPTAQVADELTAKGVVVVVSAGNEGESGTFSGGAPGVASDVITVGSVENSHARSPYFTVGKAKIAYTAATAAPAPPTSGKAPLVSAGPDSADGAAPVLGCDPATVPRATGTKQALLVKRGTCSFYDKAKNAQDAGYAALVIHNNSAGVIAATVEGAEPITIPVVTITQADGALLQERIASGSPKLTWAADQVVLPNAGAGLMSSFSSYGLTADLTLKPDLSAPGSQIWSTLPLEEGGHGSMSGTSMAAPHVAGAAALLLQEHRAWSPAQIKGALVSTADPMDWSLEPGAGYLEPVHRQGAGLLDMVEAAATSTSIAQPTVSLGDSADGGHTVTVRVRNDGDTPKTYSVGVRQGVATGGSTSDPSFEVADASVRLSARTITVQPHRAEPITVRISEDFGEDGIIYGGWIELTSADEDLSVPFAGLSGSYKKLTVLTDQGIGLPSLASADAAGDLSLVGEGATFTMSGNDVPHLVYHLEYPARRMEVVAYHAKADGTKGKLVNPAVGQVASEDFLGRDTDYEVFSWDGSYPNKNDKLKQVKDGQYILELRVLKASGSASRAKDWEVWTSPAFTVQRGGDQQ